MKITVDIPDNIAADLVNNENVTRKDIAEKFGISEQLARQYKWMQLNGKFDPYDDAVELDPHIMPRILLFDLETAFLECSTWGIWKQVIQPHQIIKPWSILSWAAKWLCESEIMGEAVTTKAAVERDDSKIIGKLWDLIDEADIIIAHNAWNFDVRRMNARFLVNDLPPPKPYQVIDTLKVSKRNFDLPSHKMDFLNNLLDNQLKDKTDYELWTRCCLDDRSYLRAGGKLTMSQQEALDYLLKYNKTDITALEELYLAIRPWIKSHPNVGLYVNATEPCCPNCGSFAIEWAGHYYTPAGRYKSFRCETCGAIGRSRFSDLKPEQRKKLTLSVAR